MHSSFLILSPKAQRPSVPHSSFIISCRNEIKNLPNLLVSIEKQTYKPNEVIFVDDNSTDETYNFLTHFAKKHDYIKVIKNTGKGKKSALIEAAKIAKSEYLIFTDADCYLNKNYCKLALEYLSKNNSDMLLGAVDILDEKGIFNIIEKIEFASLQAVTAYTALLNNPIMCNGANLIIRRTTYLQYINNINTYIASGDDMFMLHTLKKNKAKINYLYNSNYKVKTMKLGKFGVVSQGLVLPISMFKELDECNIGNDVTEKLHIEHYDELNDLYGKCNSSGGGHTSIGNAKGNFPTFCKKSDQTRIQNLMNYFDDCKDIKFTAEAKYDGSSCTVYMVDKKYDKDQFGVCSRNFNLKRPNTTKLQFIKECLFYPSYPHNPIKRLIDRFKRTLRALKSDYKSCTHSDYWKVVNNVGLEENMRNYSFFW